MRYAEVSENVIGQVPRGDTEEQTMTDEGTLWDAKGVSSASLDEEDRPTQKTLRIRTITKLPRSTHTPGQSSTSTTITLLDFKISKTLYLVLKIINKRQLSINKPVSR